MRSDKTGGIFSCLGHKMAMPFRNQEPTYESAIRWKTAITVLILVTLCFSPVFTEAYAANWYVRSGAAGNGTSWENAWGDVTLIAWASISPGDTIWLAGGSYGDLTPGKSGNADTDAGRIFVKRATTSVHGSDIGWDVSYDTQVVLSSIRWNTLNTGSYLTIDGQVERGIKIPHGSGGTAAISFDRGVSYVTLQYIETAGPGDTIGYYHTGDDRGIDITAWNGSSYEAVDYLRVRHSKIHGACTQVWNMNANNGVWEYNEIYNSTTSGTICHPNIFVTASSSNLTFRYNRVHTYSAEGIMILNGGHGSLYVYGNIWYNGQIYARVLESQDGVNGPVYFYNNTMDGLWNTWLTANGGSWASGSVASNNIYWNCNQGGPTRSYDFCSGTCTGSGSISNGSNPFVNLTGHDYRIVSTTGVSYPRDKGTDLGAPYSADMLGVTRGGDGTWDIGAYEHNSDVVIRIPAPVTGLQVN